ncbi:MAG: DUF3078 domain-containing protein [Bacteroidia bacterium]|nr:DUF3078 domain-containing protein [Bacteroidia bacterium]NNJ56420.1 DUF3078 domain-containing protein [Bacteroidia bacterium]
MKKLSLLFILSAFAFMAVAQDNSLETKKKALEAAKTELEAAKAKVAGLNADVAALTPPIIWKKGGFSAVNFNSLGLTNWAAGGVNSNSINLLGNVFANYKKDKIEWVNNLDLAYGLVQNVGEGIRKNEDKIDFLTKAGLRATDKLNYAALFNFKSQFDKGYDFTDATIDDDDRPVISKFLAPAFILASVGMDYKVTDYFSVYLSPATGKFTIVNDDSIASKNIYIPATTDDAGVQFYTNNFRAEFGALLSAILNKDLTKKINLKSTLNLFNNYTDKNSANRENIDVNWETMVNMKLTDYIGVSLFTHVIHDNDIAVSLYEDDVLVGVGPRTQFKRLLGVGFSYKF